MKKILLAALFATLISACSTVPSANEADAIKNACALDAGMRPVVNLLLLTPGVAQPNDVAAIAAARAIIDPICANPEGPIQANAIAAITGATEQIIAVSAKLQAARQ